MEEVSSWRLKAGSNVGLSDHHLAQVGLVAVLEARAKTTALGALKGLESLTAEQWLALDKIQFKQLTGRLRLAAEAKAPELVHHIEQLETLRDEAQGLRHMIVHGLWAEGPDGDPAAFDPRRERLLKTDEISTALAKCDELALLSHALMFRVAQMIESGRLPEGTSGDAGPSIRTKLRLVHL